MFGVVASVVFVGILLCIVAAVIVLAFVRKVGRDKRKRKELQKRASTASAASDQSRRSNIVMSDEKYCETADFQITSKDPRYNFGSEGPSQTFSQTSSVTTASREYYYKTQYYSHNNGGQVYDN